MGNYIKWGIITLIVLAFIVVMLAMAGNPEAKAIRDCGGKVISEFSAGACSTKR